MTRIIFEQGSSRPEFGIGGSIHEKMARHAGVMVLQNTVETSVIEDNEIDVDIESSLTRPLGAKALVGAVRNNN